MNRLRDLREDRDLTLADVGAAIGMSAMAISYYERGIRALTDELIPKFCSYYAVTADYLLGISAQPQATVSEMDTALLAAYHVAPEEIKGIVDHALAPYKQAAAGRAAS